MLTASSPKHCCRECHFFAKRILVTHRLNERIYLALRQNERTSLQVDKDSGWLACAQGVWDDRERVVDESAEDMVDKARGETCFFWPAQSGMSFDAAKVLQERASENRELKKSHRHTQWGLLIAAAGLFLSAVFGLLGLVLN